MTGRLDFAIAILTVLVISRSAMGSPPWAADGADCQAYLGVAQAASRDVLAYAKTGDQVGACAAARTGLHESLIAQGVCRVNLDEIVATAQKLVQSYCNDGPRLDSCRRGLAALRNADAAMPQQARDTACQTARNAQALLDATVARCPEAGINPQQWQYGKEIRAYCSAATPARAKKGATTGHVNKPAIAHPTAQPASDDATRRP